MNQRKNLNNKVQLFKPVWKLYVSQSKHCLQAAPNCMICNEQTYKQVQLSQSVFNKALLLIIWIRTNSLDCGETIFWSIPYHLCTRRIWNVQHLYVWLSVSGRDIAIVLQTLQVVLLGDGKGQKADVAQRGWPVIRAQVDQTQLWGTLRVCEGQHSY